MLVCFVLVFNCGVVMVAQTVTVKEDKAAKITLSVKPFTYKGKAYFPVDFIAQCFDKQIKN